MLSVDVHALDVLREQADVRRLRVDDHVHVVLDGAAVDRHDQVEKAFTVQVRFGAEFKERRPDPIICQHQAFSFLSMSPTAPPGWMRPNISRV